MDLAQMKAAVTMEGVLSGTAALELIAEVERGKTEIVRMAKEWLQEPEPDNGTVGELDVDEITVMIAGLVDKVESLTALCDGYRGEVADGYPNLEALSRGMVDGLAEWPMLKVEAAHVLSALTRARAEGTEEAVKAIRMLWPATPMGNKFATTFTEAIRAAALRARATKGDSDEG